MMVGQTKEGFVNGKEKSILWKKLCITFQLTLVSFKQIIRVFPLNNKLQMFQTN